jgi:2-methylcitrate dehydratase PrpD
MTAVVDTGTGLTASLARTLHAAVDQLNSDAILGAESLLLHAFRVSITGRDLPGASLAWKSVAPNSGACTVIGRPTGVSAPDAAFANAVAGHSSLKEDCGPGGLREGSHPGTYVIPSALAAAEIADAGGRSLLRGIIMGYDTVSRVGAASPDGIGRRRFRPVGVLAPFGAAGAAAGVWNLGPAAISSALAVSANMAAGVNQGIFEGTMEPYLHSGIGARNGLLAAHLAKLGAVTAAHSLEGEFGFFETYGGEAGSAEALTEERNYFAVTKVGTKRFAACLQNQETVALIVDTAPSTLKANDIVRVTVRRPSAGSNGLLSPGVSREAPFATMLQAQMSARFTAAAALCGAPVENAAFFRDNFDDPDVTAVAAKIDLVPSTDGSVSVEIETRNGQITLDADVSSTVFPDAAEIRSRFLSDVAPQAGTEAAEAVLDLVQRLKDDIPVARLTRALALQT